MLWGMRWGNGEVVLREDLEKVEVEVGVGWGLGLVGLRDSS